MRTFSMSLLFISFLLSWTACSEAPTAENEGETMSDEGTMEGEPANYVLTAFAPSAQFPDATIDGVTYQKGRFDFALSGKTYQLGVQTPDAPQKMCANSGEGQHIHLILDNEPYAAKYEAAFDYEVADGEHYMLAFLSRSYHESIKTDAAHTAQRITVAGKAITTAEPITDPMLFYSRPKGTYIGKAETEKVMLDFYPVNAKLGDAYKVQVDINGEFSRVIDQWQPFYIEGLPMGDNKIKLTLLDKDGAVADVPLNPVERVFTLKEDPAEAAGSDRQ